MERYTKRRRCSYTLDDPDYVTIMLAHHSDISEQNLVLNSVIDCDKVRQFYHRKKTTVKRLIEKRRTAEHQNINI